MRYCEISGAYTLAFKLGVLLVYVLPCHTVGTTPPLLVMNPTASQSHLRHPFICRLVILFGSMQTISTFFFLTRLLFAWRDATLCTMMLDYLYRRRVSKDKRNMTDAVLSCVMLTVREPSCSERHECDVWCF